MTDTIVQLLTRVMADVGAVRKGDRNDQQSFNFRGIDAVVNAVSPALRAHGVVVVPDVREVHRATVEVGRNRTPMGHVQVIVNYTFHGPAGDSLSCSAAGEAMDSGDKATPKAMSVAFRTALLQALALPTDEPDPDASSYQRTDPREINAAQTHVRTAWTAVHGAWDIDAMRNDYEQRYAQSTADASAEDLERYANDLSKEKQ